MSNPFRYFSGSPDVIRLVVMMYVRYPLSLRNVEDLLAERGIDVSYEEGIVSKRAGSRYRSGRSRNWLKTKNPDFVRT
jgi:transposase-like protein